MACAYDFLSKSKSLLQCLVAKTLQLEADANGVLGQQLCQQPLFPGHCLIVEHLQAKLNAATLTRCLRINHGSVAVGVVKIISPHHNCSNDLVRKKAVGHFQIRRYLYPVPGLREVGLPTLRCRSPALQRYPRLACAKVVRSFVCTKSLTSFNLPWVMQAACKGPRTPLPH